jgi:hypothetical protein
VFNADITDAVSAVDHFLATAVFFATIQGSATAADQIVARFLWELIDDAQTANWSGISTAQAAGWATINDAQSGAWSTVNNAQTPGWTVVYDAQSGTWTVIGTDNV